MPSQESIAIIEMLRSAPAAAEGGTIEEMRAGMENNPVFAGTPPAADVVCTPDTAGGVPIEFIVAPGASETQVILYLHGGGYTMGSIATHRGLCGRISRAAGTRVISVGYRLAPENPFPAAVDDAVAAYESLLASGYAANQLAIAGDSAGGGLTAATLLALKKRGTALPACAVLMSPWTDMVITGESIESRASRDPMIRGGSDLLRGMANMYVGEAPATNPLASPLYGELEGLPPLLIHVGSEEVLFSDADRFHKKAVAAGVNSTFKEWDGQVHVFQAFGDVPEAQQAVVEIGEFVKANMRVAVPA